jgi:hypothetical protein
MLTSSSRPGSRISALISLIGKLFDLNNHFEAFLTIWIGFRPKVDYAGFRQIGQFWS